MATVDYRTPVGIDLRDLALQAGHIGGIYIDNPSGSWLRVTGIERFVPPYCEAWSAPVVPTQTSISVLFVASPSGTPSLNVGGPTLVRLADAPYPDSPGYASGAETYQQPRIAEIQQVGDTINVTETYTATTLIPDTPGEQIIPRKFYCAATGIGNNRIHSNAILRLVNTMGFPGTLILPYITLSPERPSDQVEYEAGKAVAVGIGINVEHQTDVGGGTIFVTVFLQYYRLVNQ